MTPKRTLRGDRSVVLDPKICDAARIKPGDILDISVTESKLEIKIRKWKP